VNWKRGRVSPGKSGSRAAGRPPRGQHSIAAVSGAAFLVAATVAPWARANSEDNATNAQRELANVDRETGGVQAEVEKAKGAGLTVEQRLANGELLYRTKDYARAGVVFSEILEQYPDTPSYPDALFLRGETYYASHEYLSARRDYRQLVERGSEARFQPYLGKALARLVDVSLRVNDLKGLDEVFAKLNQVPPAQVDAGLTYAKGKAYYAKQDYTNAQQAFTSVQNNTPYTHQARYFQGLIQMKLARPSAPPPGVTPPNPPTPGPATANYKLAIEAFHAVTDLPPDSDDHKHVIDLSWMAVGRLFYEMEQYQQAAEAYSRVGRESPEFDTMLYELAWVYVRLGDVQRAERALEVLSIADPTSPYIGDGTLLRADLLLRAGAFDKALQLYDGVRTQYEPMRAKVEAFLSSTTDVAVYYDKLSQQELDTLDTNDQLPAIAVRWAREAEDGPAAFAVIDDVNQCKTLIHQSEMLVEKLNALTGAANRVRAFPELLAGETKALGLINRISHARVELAKGLDSDESSSVSGEMASVRDQRRALMNVVASTPATQADFDERDRVGTQQWNQASQELSRRTLEVDTLNATINGLRRMLKEDAQRGVTRDPTALARFNTELDQNEHDLKLYQQEMVELRRQIEIGRAQIGLGDARYQNDAVARQQFRDVLDREVQLATGGQAGADGQRYAQRIYPVLTQARVEEDRLMGAFQQLETQVAARTTELKAKIDSEGASIERYKQQLASLDGEARDLVGHVAERNFGLVRDKLRGIVLRADVGITEQAWEVREEELERVHNLQSERSREEQLLDEELREVLDDAVDPGQTGGATPPGGGVSPANPVSPSSSPAPASSSPSPVSPGPVSPGPVSPGPAPSNNPAPGANPAPSGSK
jgi:tetratricopeptide (TPR) repeat protein